MAAALEKMTGLPNAGANRIIRHQSAPPLRGTSNGRQIIPRIRRSTISALAGAFFALAMIIGTVTPAAAQQQQGIAAPPPQIVIPHSQGKETSTLELPSMPAPQGGGSLNIPPTAPQAGQSLEVPTRELRQQPGYEQVTVTADGAERHLRHGPAERGLQTLHGRAAAPDRIFSPGPEHARFSWHPVDTSGSMTPKIPQARAAIAQFLRDLNDKDDVFLFAFSSHPFLLQPFTINHDLVMRRLELLHAYGQTALFDVIMEGLHVVNEDATTRKRCWSSPTEWTTPARSTVDESSHKRGAWACSLFDPESAIPTAAAAECQCRSDRSCSAATTEHVDAETLHTPRPKPAPRPTSSARLETARRCVKHARTSVSSCANNTR